jgi:hypothetical protein
LRLAKPDEVTRAVEVPSGALVSLGDGPLGGVRGTEQASLQRVPQRLLLPGQEAYTSDQQRPLVLVAPVPPGGDVDPGPFDRPVPTAGTTDDQAAFWGPPLGYFLISPWFTGTLAQALWSWMLSPLTPGVSADMAQPADEVRLPSELLPGATAGEECLNAVDGSWAMALLAVGVLTSRDSTREQLTRPSRRPRDESQADP